MQIVYATSSLHKRLTIENKLIKAFDRMVVNEIKARLAELGNANSLADIPELPQPPRLHEYKHQNRGKFSVDIGKKCRLIFEVQDGDVPRSEAGRPKWAEIKAIRILEALDPHKRS